MKILKDLRMLVKPASIEFISSIFKRRVKEPFVLDSNATVLVSTAVLAQLGVTNGSWVIGKFSTSNEEKVRWICIYSDDSISRDSCLISNVLLCNISSYGIMKQIYLQIVMDEQFINARNRPFYMNTVNTHKIHRENISPSNVDELHVQIIDHPTYDIKEIALEDLLNDYFYTPKIVREGDVLALPSTCYDTYVNSPVYFKICSSLSRSEGCNSSCFLAAKSFTKTIYKGRCKSERIPVSNSYISSTGGINIPPYLLDVYSHIKSLVNIQLASYLPKSKRDEQECRNHFGHILLQGNTYELNVLMQYLTGSLGVSVHSVDCWQLKGDNSGSTENKVSMHCPSYRDTPSVLVLQNIDCLVKVSTD